MARRRSPYSRENRKAAIGRFKKVQLCSSNMEAKINPEEEIGTPYLIESVLYENSIKKFSNRIYHRVGIPATEKEIIQEAEDFYDEYFPINSQFQNQPLI